LHSQFLFNRFVLPHYIAGSSEVHLIFDTTNRQKFDITSFERKKRDSNKKDNAHHKCIAFDPNTITPSRSQDYISCRSCKRSIIDSIGLSLLRNRPTQRGQILILAGCFSGNEEEEDTPTIIMGENQPQPLLSFATNAEEADLIAMFIILD
jgi:hypothetical protein